MDILTKLETSILTILNTIDSKEDKVIYGKVSRIAGFMIEAIGLNVSVGAICTIDIININQRVNAEVIGFSGEFTYLMAYEDIQGIIPGNRICFSEKFLKVPVGSMLLGRVIDGLCQPMDNKGPLQNLEHYGLQRPSLNPIDKKRIHKPLDVGIKAINALLSVGQGQRLGIFAGSGVGKSILLGMMTRFTKADIVVVALIGERGREVKEFIEENIGQDNLHKTVIIAAPVDTSALMRVNGAMVASTIAEYFRDTGLDVLLIVDSLTRYAQALRQIYLTLGEIPSAKGFSPSVFAKISQLVERSGNGAAHQGSITAFYTVLVEGDDLNDPIADHARSILDGHIVLSRQMADSGHYPAIDIAASISRVMTNIISPEHFNLVQKFKRLFSAYEQNQDLIKMGMYQAGSDTLVDAAITYYDKMLRFLEQGMHENISFDTALSKLREVFS